MGIFPIIIFCQVVSDFLRGAISARGAGQGHANPAALLLEAGFRQKKDR
jgi:hypothetical protein